MLSYQELIKLSTFEERYRYLMSAKGIGPDHPEFLMERFVNQKFYRSHEWRTLKTHILVRDNGLDLALPGYPAGERAVIHHINPITIEMLKTRDPLILDPDNCVLMAFDTHQALHHGDVRIIPRVWTPRRPNDHCPWLTESK